MTRSEAMQQYFDELEVNCKTVFDVATEARKKGYDPSEEVEVSLAANMAERVVGLISMLAPQIVDSGVVERIIELEEEYGILDWRVALQISLEIAQQNFCTFKDQKEAIEIGVRTGFAYGTVGVVSAPLEGLTTIDIKDRLDGKGQYFCLNFGGPVRNAGGTAAAWSVIIADYVRKKLGFATYDPTEKEIKRCHTEISDYHERVTNLQYFPSKEESLFMIKNLPIEIGGDASEAFEVSNYKDLPRIPTNKIRSGYCLIHSSCIPLKAPKLWKQLSKWGADFDLSEWNFLEEFLKIQKKAKSGDAEKKSKGETAKITPVYTYIADLVAGRPILGHPLRPGGFRLRYGRSRTSGFSAQSIHPATMHVLNDFIATGTQLKVERPGKGAAFTPCDTIEGPIVKLKDGSVLKLDSEAEAKRVKKDVAEILYTGDILINYGDFVNRAHSLIPPGYCEEWWVQELERAMVNLFGSIDENKLSDLTDIPVDHLAQILKYPLTTKVSAPLAITLAKKLKVPLHPAYGYYWNTLEKENLNELCVWLHKAKIEKQDSLIIKGVLPLEVKPKRLLELIGVPHLVTGKEYVVIDGNHMTTLIVALNLFNATSEELEKYIQQGSTTLDVVNLLSDITIKDKAGVFIGSRMGRPEKAKMRKLTGSPHGLFPVGDEGGRMRSFQAAMTAGKIRADFPIFHCAPCERETVFSVCEVCNVKTTKKYYCSICGPVNEETCADHGTTKAHIKKDIDIQHHFKQILKRMDMTVYPDLIKGVRGTSNKDHTPEHLVKAILRAKHEIAVNKEGTVRYDCSELPITHFKPKEIRVSIDKLKELGYLKDIKGLPLKDADQVVELKPQDVLLPCCPDSPDEGCDEILFRTTKFIDELLERWYGLPPFYNLQSKNDLVGHLTIGLAPHTSAGSLFRIIGFTKTQAFFCHPLMHAAMRRDCDGDESCLFLLLDAFLNFSKKYLPSSRGSTMDAPPSSHVCFSTNRS